MSDIFIKKIRGKVKNLEYMYMISQYPNSTSLTVMTTQNLIILVPKTIVGTFFLNFWTKNPSLNYMWIRTNGRDPWTNPHVTHRSMVN